jgi:hypothetical protein
VLRVAAIQQRRAREARVVAVDRGRDRGLAPPRRQGERCDRDARLQPHARVAREEQVRQRRDDEVLRRRHALDEPAPVGAQLLTREPGNQHLRELLRPQRRQPLAQPRAQRGPDRLQRQRRVEQLLRRGRRLRQRLLEQLANVEHLHPALAQRRGERVVLGLRPRDPRHPVEQQLVVVARRQPQQLAAGTVQHDGRERPDLAGDAVGRGGHGRDPLTSPRPCTRAGPHQP